METLLTALCALSAATGSHGLWLRARAVADVTGTPRAGVPLVAYLGDEGREAWNGSRRWLRVSSALGAGFFGIVLYQQIAAALAGQTPWTRPAGVAVLCAGLLMIELGPEAHLHGPPPAGLRAALRVFLRSTRTRAAMALVLAGAVLLAA